MEIRLFLGALVSVLVAFMLAAADAALTRMPRHHAQELQAEGRRGSASLSVIMGARPAYLSVATFVRVLAEATAAVLITLAMVDLLRGFWASLLTSIGAMAVISFVIVGVSPRTLGRQHGDRVSLLAAPVVVQLRRVLGPVALLLITLGNAVTPGKGYRDGPFQSEADVRELVDMARDTAVIEDSEREMIHSVFELGDTVVREVMVPRTDMVTVDRDTTLSQAMSLFLRSGFSRIPVVGDDGPDDMLGVLYFKDVVRRTNADTSASGLPVAVQMRPPHYIPESKPVDDLLREMQQNQSHLAVVVDEYGGTAGLVTIEDILEEIVGEIADEYDREVPGVEHLADGATRIPATMHVDEMAELFGVALDDDDVDTVGGLMSKTLGQVPIPGSHAEVAGLSLTAERMAGRRHRLATVVVRRVELDADREDKDQSRGDDRSGEHDRGRDHDRSSTGGAHAVPVGAGLAASEVDR